MAQRRRRSSWPPVRVSPKGIVIAQYVRDGAVKTGDFAMDPPTPAEVARRQKMQQEG